MILSQEMVAEKVRDILKAVALERPEGMQPIMFANLLYDFTQLLVSEQERVRDETLDWFAWHADDVARHFDGDDRAKLIRDVWKQAADKARSSRNRVISREPMQATKYMCPYCNKPLEDKYIEHIRDLDKGYVDLIRSKRAAEDRAVAAEKAREADALEWQAERSRLETTE